MSSPASRKPLLFVSQYCQYSEELIQTLTKQGLIDAFQCVSVETYRVRLPSQVSCVPMLFLYPDRWLANEMLFNYMQEFIQAHVTETPQESSATYLGGYSDHYSFLDESGEAVGAGGGSGFSSLMDQTVPRFGSIEEKTSTVGGGGGGGASGKNAEADTMMSRLLEMRSMDDERIFGKQQRRA